MEAALMQVGILGYGEVGRILAEDLRARGVSINAYDTRFHESEAAAPLLAHASALDVQPKASAAELAAASDLVLSAVTASQTLTAAQACSPSVRRGSFFLDFNSASPETKRRAAAVIGEAGGRYVEGAVMTSVPPYRIKVPLLLGGPHASDLLTTLDALGFAATVASEQFGLASATKMCRSVVIKGLEALLIESLTVARSHGVEDEVLASLRETFPGVNWESQATYFFQRVIEHGRRRSEEMREAAQTVREAGLEPWSAAGAAERQAEVANLADAGVFGARGTDGFACSSDWRIEADRLLASLAHRSQ